MRRFWLAGCVLVLTPLGLAAGEEGARDRRAAETPRVSLRLGAADATGIPGSDHHARTGGGNFVVRQPSPDTLIISMTGLARASGSPAGSNAHFLFNLTQDFTVVFDSPTVKAANLQVQGYAMGVLRSPGHGSASLAKACANITLAAPAPGPEVAGFCLAPRTVAVKQNQSVYSRSERLCVPVVPACYTLHQTFEIGATEPRCSLPGHGPSADFSTSDDQTVNLGQRHDPFDGVSRRDFGFHVIVRVVPVEVPDAATPLPTPRPAPASR